MKEKGETEILKFVRIPEKRLKSLKRNKKIVKKLESFSDSKIELNDEVCIKCEDPLMVLRLEEVIKAFGRGFEMEDAMNLLAENCYLETVNIKDFSGNSESRLIALRGRVIGKEGRTKKIIEKDTRTKIAIYGKMISIIGRWDNVMLARQAIEKILRGSKHSTVYRFLEEKKM